MTCGSHAYAESLLTTLHVGDAVVICCKGDKTLMVCYGNEAAADFGSVKINQTQVLHITTAGLRPDSTIAISWWQLGDGCIAVALQCSMQPLFPMYELC